MPSLTLKFIERSHRDFCLLCEIRSRAVVRSRAVSGKVDHSPSEAHDPNQWEITQTRLSGRIMSLMLHRTMPIDDGCYQRHCELPDFMKQSLNYNYANRQLNHSLATTHVTAVS